MTCVAITVVFLTLGSASGKSFLGAQPEIDPAYINLVIQGALDGVLGSGHGFDQARLASINATLSPMFNSLPKNHRGRISTSFMRYVVHRYFSQEFGWIIKGFEPHAVDTLNRSDTHSAQIMHSKVPGFVEGVLLNTLSRGGFALPDIVIAVASISRLIFDETLKGLQTAFYLNGKSTTEVLQTKRDIAHVLTSYFIVEHLEGESVNITKHVKDRSQIGRFYPAWGDTWRFMSDIVGNGFFEEKRSSNPFKAKDFTFEYMAGITRSISENIGVFSNHECHDMKVKLAAMDVYGTGRVTLANFYKSAKHDGSWQFLETAEHLESIGALDTTSSWLGPQVIIPNYISGMNNCLSSSPYYDVCCLNECDAIYQHFESRIQKPTASVAEITRAVEEGITLHPHLTATAPTDPRNLTQSLRDMLNQVAAHHDNMVPLHGRLFAQWLHYAFPHECQYPHMSGTISRDWAKRQNIADATMEDMNQIIDSEIGRRPVSPDAGKTMWNLQEELLEPKQVQNSWGPLLRKASHLAMMVSFAVVLLKELKRLRGYFTSARKEESTMKEVSYLI